MTYKGHDLDLRLLLPAATRETTTPADHPADAAWMQPARPGSAITVDEAVLACCNSAYDVAAFHAADAVRLEHLLHAMTRVSAAADLLAELGIRVDRLRRETAAAIAADMPAGPIERAGAPPASAALEDVLRRAGELAAKRWGPATLADVLRTLLGGGPGSPAAAMLLRAAADPQRLERWRDELRRDTLAALPSPGEAEAKALQLSAGAALREQLGHMETALRTLREEVAADRKAFGDLLRDVWAELPALRALRDEVAADRKALGELVGDVRSELQALRKDADAGAGGTRAEGVDALLEARLEALGKATAELAERLPTIQQLIAGDASQALLNRLEAVEERIALRALEGADKVAGVLAERLERTEASLRRLQEASDRNWTSGGERQIALEASVRAQMQTAEEANKAYERHLGEIYEALVKLGANHQTLGDNFAAWRTETAGDIGILNNRLQQLEQLLGQLGSHLQLLGRQQHDGEGRRGNGFKRWLYGTSHVFAAARRSARPPGEQAS
jgi:hypothetical protein